MYSTLNIPKNVTLNELYPIWQALLQAEWKRGGNDNKTSWQAAINFTDVSAIVLESAMAVLGIFTMEVALGDDVAPMNFKSLDNTGCRVHPERFQVSEYVYQNLIEPKKKNIAEGLALLTRMYQSARTELDKLYAYTRTASDKTGQEPSPKITAALAVHTEAQAISPATAQLFALAHTAKPENYKDEGHFMRTLIVNEGADMLAKVDGAAVKDILRQRRLEGEMPSSLYIFLVDILEAAAREKASIVSR